MTFSKPFFDLQLAFAGRVAAISGLPLEQALMDYTNLYIRFGLGRGFDSGQPLWIAYLDSLGKTDDDTAWTYRHYLACAPSDLATPGAFGCFSYARHGDAHIRLHFNDTDRSGHSPLSHERVQHRQAELRALFDDVRRTGPADVEVLGTSWLYTLRACRRILPPSFLASATPAAPRFRNLSLWGQFLDRHLALRDKVAAPFALRVARQTSVDGLLDCFPCRALDVAAPAADFYAFYDI